MVCVGWRAPEKPPAARRVPIFPPIQPASHVYRVSTTASHAVSGPMQLPCLPSWISSKSSSCTPTFAPRIVIDHAKPLAVTAPPRRAVDRVGSTIDPASHSAKSSRCAPLASSRPVKTARGLKPTYYTFTGAMGRQSPELTGSVGPVWHLR